MSAFFPFFTICNYYTYFVYPLLNKPDAPNVSIKGTIPIENINIDNAPTPALPVPNAKNCIVCKGPQGIKPLRSPTKNVALGLLMA